MTEGKILPYLDIPFQHASPDVLKAMKRPAAQEKTLARIQKWREQCLDLTLRSTFIVGFPGETDPICVSARLARGGRDRSSSAASNTSRWRAHPRTRIGNAVPDEIKQERWNALMARQQKISARRLKRKVGTPAADHRRRSRPDGREGPFKGRRAADRRRGLSSPAAVR